MDGKIQTLVRLKKIIDHAPAMLDVIPDTLFNFKENANKWSKKEILGHLIDSATNNHHRFVISQFQDIPTIVYDQVNWVAANRYQDASKAHLISFWTIYNQHIYHVVNAMPREMLLLLCNSGDAEHINLETNLIGYVNHLEHHLKQILGDDKYSLLNG